MIANGKAGNSEVLGVIFDVDGVLVDSYWAHYRSWQMLAAELGLELTEEQFAATFGMTSREIIERFWSQRRFSREEIDRLDRRKEALYRELIAKEFLAMDGAVELVRSLHVAGFKLGIGSSAPPQNVEVSLRGLGLAELFDAVVTGADVERGKPDPEVFLKAAAKLGLAPAACAVLEDSPAGITAALRAGMVAIGVASTGRDRRSLAHAAIVVDSLKELNPQRIAALIRAREAP